MARTITMRGLETVSALVIASLVCASAITAPANAGTLVANRPPPTEDCVTIEPMTVAAINTNGDWTVALGTSAPLDFGGDEAQAERAVAVIQHYHFTRECFVRRPNPHMMYWRNGVAVPPGNMPDQDCITVNPADVEVQWVNGGWKVLDGANWLLDYGVDRAAADQAVAIIRAYNLNRECFIARPHVTMQYWLAQ